MPTVLYPGSFDPPTLGHMDIIFRAAGIFDRVVVSVMASHYKTPLFNVETRVKMLKEAVVGYNNIEITSFDGLTIDCAAEHSASAIIKGVRNAADYSYEQEMARINGLTGGIETIVFFADPELSHISSAFIREFASRGRDVSSYIPSAVIPYLTERFKQPLG